MEKYYVINEQDEIEYLIFEEETNKGVLYSLFYSENKEWTEQTKGKLIMTAENDGNDIKFTPTIKKTMDFAELFELNIMLAYIRKDDREKFPCRIVKAETISTI